MNLIINGLLLCIFWRLVVHHGSWLKAHGQDGPGTSSRPPIRDKVRVSIQAPQVVAWFKRTMPPHNGLRTYQDLEGQIEEVQRRAADTKSARFLPLVIAKWNKGDDGGYPEILLAFNEACNGEKEE